MKQEVFLHCFIIPGKVLPELLLYKGFPSYRMQEVPGFKGNIPNDVMLLLSMTISIFTTSFGEEEEKHLFSPLLVQRESCVQTNRMCPPVTDIGRVQK